MATNPPSSTEPKQPIDALDGHILRKHCRTYLQRSALHEQILLFVPGQSEARNNNPFRVQTALKIAFELSASYMPLRRRMTSIKIWYQI